MENNKKFIDYIFDNSLFKIILSIILAFIFGAMILTVMGFDALYIYDNLFKNLFYNKKVFTSAIVYSIPLIITGLSVVLSLNIGIFNIGVEGQFVIGMLGAYIANVIFSKLPSFFLIPICFLFAFIFAAIFAMIVSFLKIRYKINEVISMIMLNWIAFYFSNFIIELPMFRNKNGYNCSEKIFDNASLCFPKEILKKLGLSIDLNYGIIIAILIVIIIYILLEKSVYGYAIKAIGKNINAAKFNGINVDLTIFTTMALSGGIAGISGAIYLLGYAKKITIYVSQEGFGFNGIVVALLGMNNPIGCIFSGFFYGFLIYSGKGLNLINAPIYLIDIIAGIIIFFISISSIFIYIKNILRRK